MTGVLLFSSETQIAFVPDGNLEIWSNAAPKWQLKITEHKYLQEGIHLLLNPVDKPPLDYKADKGEIMQI